MSTLRMFGMILVCGALGYLVWIDNFAGDGGIAPPRTGQLDPAGAALTAGVEQREGAVIAAPVSDDEGERAVEVAAEPEGTPSGRANAERAAAATPEEDEGDGNSFEDNVRANPLSSVDINLLSDTIERPLFASSRQRPPPRGDASEPDEKSSASFELLGVVVSGARATAVLRRIESGANFSVEVGDSLAGWKIARIDPTAVVLEEAGGAIQRIELVKN